MPQKKNDENSQRLEQWIKEYSQPLLDRAYYLLSNKEDAKDAVQEVFLAACKSIELFQAKSSPLTWLMGILHHKINDIYNNRYKRDSRSLDFEQVFNKHGEWLEEDVLDPWIQEESSTGTLLDNTDFRQVFSECLDRLPLQWSVVVNKCYLQEQKATEICRELNLSSANYWKMLQRSRLQLRKCIDIHWFKIGK